MTIKHSSCNKSQSTFEIATIFGVKVQKTQIPRQGPKDHFLPNKKTFSVINDGISNFIMGGNKNISLIYTLNF